MVYGGQRRVWLTQQVHWETRVGMRIAWVLAWPLLARRVGPVDVRDKEQKLAHEDARQRHATQTPAACRAPLHDQARIEITVPPHLVHTGVAEAGCQPSARAAQLPRAINR